MEKSVDSKRKSRNLSEKKRRDQFNNLINELNNLIDPHFNNPIDEEDDIFGGQQQQQQQSGRTPGALSDFEMGDYQAYNLLNNADPVDANVVGFRASSLGYQQRMFGSLPAGKKAASSASSLAGSSSRQRKMDKSSVLKRAMEFLREHANPQKMTNSSSGRLDDDPRKDDFDSDMLDTSPWKPPYITDDEFSVQMLEALDAFIVVCEVSPEARIIYSSDTLTNLLNYAGTCNSLRHYDYVSLFDLIAPFDRTQIEKLFSEQPASQALTRQQPEDNENQYLTKPMSESNNTSDNPNYINYESTRNCRPAASNKSRLLPSSGQSEYISLTVNFRNGLNLSEIKQKRLQQRNSVLQPYGQNHKASQTFRQNSSGISSEEQLILQQCQQEIFMQMTAECENSCGRSQQSIAEHQQHLLSEGRREQQEHNQNQQQQQQQHQRRQVVASGPMLVDNKRLSDDQQMSDGSNGNSSDDMRQQVASSKGTNSDENDQPSGTGSDDASDSNQSQTDDVGSEGRHHYHYRHHHHNHHHHHYGGHSHSGSVHSHHHQRRQKQSALASSRQQYELVRLMATFKGLEDYSVRGGENSFNRYKMEEPPPKSALAKGRYFICIGRLEIPRLSYDLKIIVPPMRGGSNVFHNNQFLSKHTLKWRFLWVDNKAPAIIGYLPFEVLGTSGYDYYHWDDLDKLVISHEGLMRDGQASSGPYRFLTKGQQWIWLQTKYCIILKPRSIKAGNSFSTKSLDQFKFILCTHTVIGFDETSDAFASLNNMS